MKKIFSFSLLLIAFSVFAQAPTSINYQAAIRDAANNILSNQEIGLRITIKQGVFSGSVVYQESFTDSTNSHGLVNIVIGTGTIISGSFQAIDWGSGPYFMETAVDITGGVNYDIMGTQQLMSVPYALYSNVADSIVGGAVKLENDPIYGASIASGITAIDTANWNQPDTKLDSSEISNMGFLSGKVTPTIEYKKLYMSNAYNYMANLSWLEIYTNGTNGDLVLAVPSSASASVRMSYAVDNGVPISSTVGVGDSILISSLYSARLEITCVEYSNTGTGGVLNWTGIGMQNGWLMGHVLFED